MLAIAFRCPPFSKGRGWWWGLVPSLQVLAPFRPRKGKSIQTLVFFDQENKSCLPQQPGAGGKELDYQRPGLGPSGSFLSLTASACVETSREGKFSALHLLPALGPAPVSGCCMAHCAQQGLPGLH